MNPSCQWRSPGVWITRCQAICFSVAAAVAENACAARAIVHLCEGALNGLETRCQPSRRSTGKPLTRGLKERPDLLSHREEREKKSAAHAVLTKLRGGSRPSIKTADVLLERGIDLHAHAFTEGT
jgi:hypothetical protein